MKRWGTLIAMALAGIMATPAAGQEKPAAAAPSLSVPQPVLTQYYPREANAAAAIEGALAEARAGGRQAVLVFGADWCSDSTALAAVLSSDMFRARFGRRFNTVFIDVNRPTKGEGRNQDQIARFGVTKMTGTPELLVIGAAGKPLNSLEDAHTWRDAGGRSVDAIMGWFAKLDQSTK